MMAIEQKLLEFYNPKSDVNQSYSKKSKQIEQYPDVSGENLNKGGNI